MAARRFASTGNGRFKNPLFLKSLIQIALSIHFIYQTFTSLDPNLAFHPNLDSAGNFDLTSPADPNFSKFSKFSLLSSSKPFRNSKFSPTIFSPKFPPSDLKNQHWLCIFLLLAGDTETNPGPPRPGTRNVKWPCGECKKNAPTNCVQCDSCLTWFHSRCISKNSQLLKNLGDASWHCIKCGIPQFNSSLFDSTPEINSSSSFENSHSIPNSSNRSPRPILTSSPKNHSKGQPTDSKSKLPYSLSFLIINFQSLWNKRVALANLASESRSDVIIGTETWLTSGDQGIKNSELLLDDYDIFRRDRATKGGGVMLAVKKSLNCELISSAKDSETLFCKIKLKGKKPLILGSVYRPPAYDLDQSQKIVQEIYSITSKFKGAVFWIGGDFNLPDISWSNQDIINHQYQKEINESFLEMSQDLGLTQIVDIPTRGTSLLDLLFTNHPDLVKKCYPISGLGDHEVVRINSSLQAPRKKPTKRRIQLWNKVDVSKLKEEVLALSTNFLKKFSPSDNVLDIWNFLKIEFYKIIEKNVPTKLTSSKIHQPWINTETKRLLRKKNRWFKKAKSSDSPHIWNTYKKIKSQTQRTCRKTHETYLNSLFSDDKNNKKLWSYIKSKRSENVGISELKNKNNIPTNDPVKKADLIHEQFDSVFSNPSPKITHTFDQKDRLPNIHSIRLNKPGLLKLLLNLDPNKANGPDNVPTKFLKICAHEVVDMYLVLFQASLDQGVVPPDWKEGNIVPLYKKGDRSLPENYRPITLTSISCKLLEHVVHSNIMTHLDKFNVLDNAQHGFRKRRSCISQLLTTVDDFANCLKNHQQIDAILLDFSKAFDKVDHEGLILKLEHLGIRNSLLNWVRSFLIGRNQRVLVEGMASTPSIVKSGVPQGTVLGPLFFLVYINDISKGLSKGTKIRLFADDSLLYRKIDSPNDSATLQKDLDTLQNWEQKWKMEFHPGKCQLLRITHKINPLLSTYNIHGIPISLTDSAKYLGVVIDSKLTWKNQYSNIVKKCNSSLAFLRRNLPSSCPRQVREKCYRTLVRPSADYGCQVWDPHYSADIQNLEKIQKRGARFVTNNYSMESGNSQRNLHSLGWTTLEERRLQLKLATFKKAQLKLLDLPLGNLRPKARQTRQGGEGLSFYRPFSPINGHVNSFFHQTPQIWNLLPVGAKLCEEITFFNQEISKINLTQLKNSIHSVRKCNKNNEYLFYI